MVPQEDSAPCSTSALKIHQHLGKSCQVNVFNLLGYGCVFTERKRVRVEDEVEVSGITPHM